MKWNELFVGRETELEQLITDWDNIKDGKPRIRVILGETGLGKTRLIQQFYNHISINNDANGYWPDKLNIEKSLSLNPDFKNKKNQSDKIPWFWWALRGTKPGERNQSEGNPSVLIEPIIHLTSHIKYLKNKSNLTSEKLSLGENILKLVIAISSGLTPVAVGTAATVGTVGTVGIVGILGATLVGSVGVLSAFQDTRAAVGNIDNIDNMLNDNNTILDYQNTENKELFETIVEYFEQIGKENIPIIIIIDDAQWVDKDTIKFINELYRKALEYEWPLYIIATHWLGEWKMNKEKKDSFSYIYHQVSDLEPIQLEPISEKGEINKIIKSSLPGITGEQLNIINNRVAGNLGFLHDLILYILKDEYWFKENNFQKQLNKDGERALKKVVKLKHIELLEERFDDFDKELQQILMWSSYQGIEFSELLTKNLSYQINRNINANEQIKNAKDHYSAIEDIGNNISAFSSDALHEIAFDSLIFKPKQFDDFKKQFYLLINELFDNKKYKKLPIDREKFLLIMKSNDNNENLPHVLIELLEFYDKTKQIDKLDKIANDLTEIKSDQELDITILTSAAHTLNEFLRLNNSINLWTMFILQEEKSDKTPIRQNNLIGAYINRGIAYHNKGVIKTAYREYNKAIELLEELDPLLGENFPISMQHSFAIAYINRGYDDLNDNNHYPALIKDCNKAIKILEDIRDLKEEEFSLSMQHNLTIAYFNRATAYHNSTKLPNGIEDFNTAMEDYNTAISLSKNIQTNLKEKFSLLMQHDLAKFYIGRGGAYANSCKLLKRDEDSNFAMGDYKNAIEILKNIKTNTRKQFTFLMENDLADAHIQRASIYKDFELFREADDEYSMAIDMLEDIKTILGKQFSSSMVNNLAKAYLGYATFYKIMQVNVQNDIDQKDMKHQDIQKLEKKFISLLTKLDNNIEYTKLDSEIQKKINDIKDLSFI